MKTNRESRVESRGLERGVYAASLFGSPQTNRIAYAIQALKRTEGRAPGVVPGCAWLDGISRSNLISCARLSTLDLRHTL
jgi:hypothetical protein